MSATKEQERQALKKIRIIVAELGHDSYIAAAFEGCFDMAEENINNDFACSMKQRAESAENRVEYYKATNKDLSTKVEDLETRIAQLETRELTVDIYAGIYNAIMEGVNALTVERDKLAEVIVENATRPRSEEFINAVEKHTEVKERINRSNEIIAKVVKMVESRS